MRYQHPHGDFMKKRNAGFAFARGLACLLVLAVIPPALAQHDDRASGLQSDALARLNRWRDYVRRTGDAQSTISELSMAQAESSAALNRFLQIKDYGDAAWSAINLAEVLRSADRYEQAIPIYKQADDLAQMARRPDYEAKALARMAFAETSLKRLDAASDHVQRAVALGQNCGNPDFYFDALLTATELETTRGNLPAASDYAERAFALVGELHDQQQVYLVYGDRADVYYQKAHRFDCQKTPDLCIQSYDRAKADYQSAQSIALKLGYTFLAQNYAQELKTAEAQAAILEQMRRGAPALPATMFAPRVPKDVLVTENFAAGASDPGTVAMLKKIVGTVEKQSEDYRRKGLLVQDLNSVDYSIRGQLAEMSGEDESALQNYRRAVQLVEQDRRKLKDDAARSSFMDDKLDCYYRPALLLLQQRRYSEAFALYEQSRARSIADMLFSSQLAFKTPQERDLFSRLQTQRTTIAARQMDLFALTSSEYRDKNGRKIADLERVIEGMQQQYQQLESVIAAQAPRLKQMTQAEPATLESVQRAASLGDFDLLYYVVSDTAIIEWLVNGSGVHVKDVFLPRSQLINKVATLRESLESGPDTPFDEEHARQLYLYLIQPLAPYIHSHHLVIIPHEELNSIPFQVFLDPGTGIYLGETYAVSYAPSATVLKDLASSGAARQGKLLAVADPGLAAAVDEVNSIARFYPNRSKVVQAASKTELNSLVAGYDVVHLSMHGEFDEREPMLSYLQLKPAPPDNGRLTAAEIFGLPLKRNALVVLSACESGRVQAGHSNEVEGLVSGLLYAGAGTLVLSDWKVDAASTSVWMQAFYREAQSRPPAEAARLALIAVKSQPGYGHPYFWAPFLVTGR
jgi:CHAT domain-containing protein/tetratricopeptide (TPR) repeat protein